MNTALEQLEHWITQYKKINGTPPINEVLTQIDLLKDYEKEQCNIDLVSKRELTGDDLIEFSIWLIGKSYEHRLAILPNDLVDYYLKNRDSIIENNNVC
tara:strand:- start:7568 stop:7864 length:297 start_codon:yes stop_codon:yes gene_type:complete